MVIIITIIIIVAAGIRIPIHITTVVHRRCRRRLLHRPTRCLRRPIETSTTQVPTTAVIGVAAVTAAATHLVIDTHPHRPPLYATVTRRQREILKSIREINYK